MSDSGKAPCYCSLCHGQLRVARTIREHINNDRKSLAAEMEASIHDFSRTDHIRMLDTCVSRSSESLLMLRKRSETVGLDPDVLDSGSTTISGMSEVNFGNLGGDGEFSGKDLFDLWV